jgi:hypothetical protein
MAREPFEGCSADDPVIIPAWAPLCDDLVLEEPDYVNNTPTVDIPDISATGLCACYPEVNSETDPDDEVNVTYVAGGGDTVFKLLRVDEQGRRSDEPNHDFDCCFPDVSLLFDLNLDCIPFNVNSNVNVVGGTGGSTLELSVDGCDLNLDGTLNLAAPGGGVTGAENIGNCAGEFFKQEVGGVLQFRTLDIDPNAAFILELSYDPPGNDCILLGFNCVNLGHYDAVGMALVGGDVCDVDVSLPLNEGELLWYDSAAEVWKNTKMAPNSLFPESVPYWDTIGGTGWNVTTFSDITCQGMMNFINYDPDSGSIMVPFIRDNGGMTPDTCEMALVCDLLKEGLTDNYDAGYVQVLAHNTDEDCTWLDICELLATDPGGSYVEADLQILYHQPNLVCEWGDPCTILKQIGVSFDLMTVQILYHDTNGDCDWTDGCDVLKAFDGHISAPAAGDVIFISPDPGNPCEWVDVCNLLHLTVTGADGSEFQILTHDGDGGPGAGTCRWVGPCDLLTPLPDYDAGEIQILTHDTGAICRWSTPLDIIVDNICEALKSADDFDHTQLQLLAHDTAGSPGAVVCQWVSDLCPFFAAFTDYDGGTAQVLTHDTSGDCLWIDTDALIDVCAVMAGFAGYDGGTTQVLTHVNGVCTWVDTAPCP